MKNKEKAPSDTNKKGRGLGSRNTVPSKDFSGMSKSLNALQVKFNCREGNEEGRFLEFLRVTTVNLIMKLEGGGDIKTPIRNGKVFEPAWPDSVGQYGTREKRVDKLWINLSTSYGLVIGQCTNDLRSRLEG